MTIIKIKDLEEFKVLSRELGVDVFYVIEENTLNLYLESESIYSIKLKIMDFTGLETWLHENFSSIHNLEA